MTKKILSLFLIPIFIGLAGAQQKPAAPAPAPPKVEIRHAEEAEYLGAEKRIVLTGAVHVVRGTMSIRADRVNIQLNDLENEVVTARATGKVVVVDGARKGTAENAVFVKETSEIVLTGSPRLYDGPNEIEAERILYNLDDRSMRATGSVRGILIPSSN